MMGPRLLGLETTSSEFSFYFFLLLEIYSYFSPSHLKSDISILPEDCLHMGCKQHQNITVQILYAIKI